MDMNGTNRMKTDKNMNITHNIAQTMSVMKNVKSLFMVYSSREYPD